MQEGDFDKMREETFSEFCVGGGQKRMAAPGLWALRCPVESSHVLAVMGKLACGWVSGGLPRTPLFPSPHTMFSPARHENTQSPSQKIEGINFQ